MNDKQINLLPDLKQERLARQRQERFMRLMALAVIVVMATVATLMVAAALLQRQSLISTQESIAEEQAAINAIPDKDELLGMQVALRELPALGEQRLYVSSITEILEQVVPAEVELTTVEYQAGGIMQINGEAERFSDIYTFVDALERAEGSVTADGEESEEVNYFSGVNLEDSNVGDEISFTISAVLDESFINALGDRMEIENE